jgi:proteic killer suppression protein
LEVGRPRDGRKDVEVLFLAEKLRDICSSQALLTQRYGTSGARKVMLRLQQLDAAENLGDMKRLPGRVHELTGDRAGQLAADLDHPRRLIFRPTTPSRCLKADGGLDWAAVDSITVIEIADYH